MNYYEELGVSPSAPAQEIRKAYKTLVRLLHPDQYGGEALRGAAALQMKRLNGILAILTDPVERARYDAALREEQRPRAVGEMRREVWACLLAGAAALAALAFFLGRNTAPSRMTRAGIAPATMPRAAAPARPAGLPAAVSAELTRLRREMERLRAERDSAVRAAAPPPRSVRGVEQVVPPPVLQEELLFPTEPEAQQPSRAGESVPPGLAGRWFYVRSVPQPRSGGLYPPEYIELALRESGGLLIGKYRARYRVADQAISPDVSFEFRGPAGASQRTFRWTGPGGARGEVALKLTGENVLEVSWKASRLSNELSLVSGFAVLLRAEER